jgi:hypothetical protein
VYFTKISVEAFCAVFCILALIECLHAIGQSAGGIGKENIQAAREDEKRRRDAQRN